MKTAIRAVTLRKSFGRTRALDGLDLTVRTGEVHGFLGPNGSGKSTTIGVLLGLLRADGGTAEVLGGDPWRDAVSLHRRIAYVPGDVTLWPNLTGGEVIDLLGRLRGSLDPDRRDRLVRRFERVRFQVDSERIGAALDALGKAGIRSLTSSPPTLEALFLRHYGDGGTDHATADPGAAAEEAALPNARTAR